MFTRSFKDPRDEWPLLLCLLRARGETDIVGISPRFMRNARSRERLRRLMAHRAKAQRALAVVFLCPGWRRVRSNQAREATRRQIGGEPPEASSDFVLIQEIQKGDVRTHIAAVNRSENKPPTLNPWATVDDSPAGDGSRFVDAVLPIIKANRTRYSYDA